MWPKSAFRTLWDTSKIINKFLSFWEQKTVSYRIIIITIIFNFFFSKKEILPSNFSCSLSEHFFFSLTLLDKTINFDWITKSIQPWKNAVIFTLTPVSDLMTYTGALHTYIELIYLTSMVTKKKLNSFKKWVISRKFTTRSFSRNRKKKKKT